MFHKSTTGEIFNLGNPEERTVLEWARMILDLCDSASPLIFEPRRDDDPERRRPDIAKAAGVLGWVPNVTPEQGLRRTIEWFRVQLDGSEAYDQLAPAAARR